MSLVLYVRDGQVVGGGDPLRVGSVVVTPEDAARERVSDRQGIR
jgi:hypothetical protein